MTEVVGIAAVARNGVIGAGQDIPWRIPEDWRRFRSLTMGHVLVMGRKTYDSIGRPLPGRTTIVVTRDPCWRAAGVGVAATVEQALASAADLQSGSIYVAGGGEIYRACWHRLGRLEITEVHTEADGDVTFPKIDPHAWQQTFREAHDGVSWVSYARRSGTEEGTRTLTPGGTGT
ncbi:MAG TPA: dihydrofolate reductase [Propionibacteriaceae bacterium]|nr:dihydrofolate reductase [Propionibacteriaceae bacterium]